MSERLLLNLLLSLTQVFGYQLIMFHGSYERNRRQAQFLMGGVSGISCVLCMMFPVAMGTHFLWDLRWPVFLLSVLYGGFRGGAICAAMMLSYRAYLGGLISWIMVALDVIVLFLMMMYYRKYIDNNQGKQQRLLWNVIIGLGTYLWVELSIYLYFLWNHDSAFFLHQGMHFYITYGIVTVFAYVSSIVLIESIFTQVAMRKDIAQAEKLV